jgi:putative aldouronate transport system substrate-binding protein
MGETNWNAPDTHCNIYFYEKDGKLIPQATRPEAKEALTVLAQWYKEGLIDPEFASQKNTVFDEKMVSNRFGVATYWWNWEAQREVAMKVNDPNVELIRIAPPKGPTGLSGLRGVPEVVSAVGVMKTTKYPEECAKF